MRNYANVPTNFWTSKTGRAIRAAGLSAQAVAFYLLTNPHSNYSCVYYLPESYIAADIGLPVDEVHAALEAIEATGFARYDSDSECVWVVEGASWQIGASLKEGDKKVIYIQKEFDAIPEDCPYKDAFMAKYGDAYHMRGSNAPAKAPEKKKAEAKKVPEPSPVASKDSAEAAFMSKLEKFQQLRTEEGFTNKEGAKRIADAAISLANKVGFATAAAALVRASGAGDFAKPNFDEYILESDKAPATAETEESDI